MPRAYGESIAVILRLYNRDDAGPRGSPEPVVFVGARRAQSIPARQLFSQPGGQVQVGGMMVDVGAGSLIGFCTPAHVVAILTSSQPGLVPVLPLIRNNIGR